MNAECWTGKAKMPAMRRPRRLPFIIQHSSFIVLALCLSGCTLLGVAAYKLKPPETVQPKYMGLENQTTGVMVWADRGLRIDWPTIQVDLANTVQKKLVDFQKAGKRESKTLAGTSFPVQPNSIIRYQRDHPEIEAMPIEEVAPRLGVNRLIYVELQDFATRSEESVQLFRGTANATVKLIEVDADAAPAAKVAFEINNVTTHFPPKAPPEGTSSFGDVRIYGGTVD